MNRREFIGTGVAAALSALVPTWAFVRKPSPIDLTVFCQKGENYIYDAQEPFVQAFGDAVHRYATDGRIAVRINGHESDCQGDEKRRPAAARLFFEKSLDQSGKWVKWPKAEYIDGDSTWCPACDGTGEADGSPVEECDDCQGVGEFYRGERFTEQCPTCKGEGNVVRNPCPVCKGKASGPFPAYQKIGGLWIAVEYDRKIRKHLVDREAEFFLPHIQKKDEPIRFRFGDGQGLLMSIVRPV